jgi:hypothetical protein
MAREYIDAAVAAKMLREALKRNFPGVKFSVRTSKYSGGASVRVSYATGPTVERVQSVAQRFSGADFDGMTDSKSYHSAVLVAPDGAMREVHFGSDYVFVDRDEPQGLYDAVVAKLAASWEPVQWAKMPDYERERMARRGICLIDLPLGEPLDVSAERAVAAFFGREVQPEKAR